MHRVRLFFISLNLLLLNECFCQISNAGCVGKDTLQWAPTTLGCLHFYAYTSDSITSKPNLVVVIHGDAPFNNPGYQYRAAKIIAVQNNNVIAIGILRPGYLDPDGNKSAGVRGLTTGDNYTADVINAIAEAIKYFKVLYHPGRIFLVGHSGGAAIAADIIALKAGLVDKAVIVSCPCNLSQWRDYMAKKQPGVTAWKDSVASISPEELVSSISNQEEVLIISGKNDDIAPTQLSVNYSNKLKEHGIKSALIQIPNQGHDILLEGPVLAAIKTFLSK